MSMAPTHNAHVRTSGTADRGTTLAIMAILTLRIARPLVPYASAEVRIDSIPSAITVVESNQNAL